MPLSTWPCDFGHRPIRLLRSSLRSNDPENHRVGCAGCALLVEPAGCVRVTADERSPCRARRFACSRSLLLPGISPADFADPVPGDQLACNALRRAASVLRPACTIEPVDYARRDQRGPTSGGTSIGDRRAQAFPRSRSHGRDFGDLFPSASLRTKHRSANLSFCFLP